MTQTASENPTTTPDAAAPIAICVIGAGHLGQHHVRLLSSMEGARLQGVVDVDPDRARNFASKYGTEALSNFEMIPAATQCGINADTDAFCNHQKSPGKRDSLFCRKTAYGNSGRGRNSDPPVPGNAAGSLGGAC